MDEAALHERIEELRAEMTSIREQAEKIRREAEGRLNVLQGAVIDCEHWLNVLNKGTAEATPANQA